MHLYYGHVIEPFKARHALVIRMIIGAILIAVFIGLAQRMRISEAETRYDRCLLEVEEAEWQCRKTGKYPYATSGPVDVIDLCETYALHDKDMCANLHIVR